MEQQNLDQETQTEESEIKSQVVEGVDLDALDEVEHESPLKEFELKLNKIVEVQTIRLKSRFAMHEDGMCHNMKFVGEIVKEDVDKDGKKLEFRPSILIPLEEDEKGKLKGLPLGKKSKWIKLKNTLKITKPGEAIGKELPMKLNESGWLEYLY